MKENQTDSGMLGEIIDKVFEKGVLFKIVVIIFLIWFTWNIYQIRTQKYTYKIEFAEDKNVDSMLNSYGDMSCVIDSARRATSGESIYTTKAGYEFVFRCPK